MKFVFLGIIIVFFLSASIVSYCSDYEVLKDFTIGLIKCQKNYKIYLDSSNYINTARFKMFLNSLMEDGHYGYELFDEYVIGETDPGNIIFDTCVTHSEYSKTYVELPFRSNKNNKWKAFVFRALEKANKGQQRYSFEAVKYNYITQSLKKDGIELLGVIKDLYNHRERYASFMSNNQLVDFSNYLNQTKSDSNQKGCLKFVLKVSETDTNLPITIEHFYSYDIKKEVLGITIQNAYLKGIQRKCRYDFIINNLDSQPTTKKFSFLGLYGILDEKVNENHRATIFNFIKNVIDSPGNFIDILKNESNIDGTKLFNELDSGRYKNGKYLESWIEAFEDFDVKELDNTLKIEKSRTILLGSDEERSYYTVWLHNINYRIGFSFYINPESGAQNKQFELFSVGVANHSSKEY